ncbi:MAG TPA: tRNA lysidine(34) synthetase TilS, partial [Tenuifilaceae bacterium]|nr:tRNA lysidine(34) synthetase TilS [Tenuifilaceae bacterium]
MLQDKFINFIRVHRLADENDSILLGVSGGIDSMVMLHLFQKTGFKFAVAHCNFGLRGEESDGDEEFTRTYCREKGVVFHTTKFSTVQYATDKSVSIQVAARELRYDYFNELCREHGYNKIAIAHNMNDSAETVLLNLIRGAGIRGLTGIRPVHGNIIRPLLFATRPEIENYSKQLGISYREDSSNATLKYKRNFIRHRVIPLLQELNPSAVETIYDSSYHVNEAISLVDRQLDEIRRKVVSFRK